MSRIGAGIICDLRSDTLTVPTEPMRQAMASADVGDDVYGEDPTVIALEEHLAGMLGHEAGLFCPTGSLANWLAVKQLVDVGQELLCDDQAHIVRAELGAHGALGGATVRTWASKSDSGRPAGEIDVDRITSMLAPAANPYLVGTAAVCVENTHNFGGGTVQPLMTLKRLQQHLDERSVFMHMDGARLWNACVATGCSPAEYARCATTVSVCFSKGLGAPVGSMLVGPQELIRQARVWRKRMGAGMRQVGVLAAAAQYAVDHHIADLAEDHRRALALAHTLAEALPGCVQPHEVTTNIVLCRVAHAERCVAQLAEQGVRALSLDHSTVRFITHRGIDDIAMAYAQRAVAKQLAAMSLPDGGPPDSTYRSLHGDENA